MESKDHIEVEVNESCDCVSELRKKYEYIDRYTHDSFTEIKNPVIDSEGLIREKSEPNINKSLHSPEKNVAVFESSDLKKVQKDFQKLETSYCKKKIKISDLKNMIVEQNINWERQARKWDEQKENTNLMIDKLENTIKNQNEQIDNLMKTIKDKDKDILDMEKENKALKYEIDEKKTYIDQLEKAQEENDNYAGMQVIELAWKKPDFLPPQARWHDRDTVLGVKHTFFDEDYPREKQENDFRRYAYEGNVQYLRQLLSIDKSLVNGRGMPDSFGSTIKSWRDKTPLMLAAQQGHKACVKVLLENGAHLDYLDRNKCTALDYAEENNHESVAVFLKKRGAQNGRYLKNIFENMP